MRAVPLHQTGSARQNIYGTIPAKTQQEESGGLSKQELATEETEEVMQIVTSWMKEGIEQGRREGRI